MFWILPGGGTTWEKYFNGSDYLLLNSNNIILCHICVIFLKEHYAITFAYYWKRFCFKMHGGICSIQKGTYQPTFPLVSVLDHGFLRLDRLSGMVSLLLAT